MRAGSTPKGTATRQRLLEVATTRLAETGTLGVGAVAADAGVSPSVLYRYFAGRDGLIAAVVESFYDEYEREVFDVPDVPGRTWLDRERLRLDLEVRFFYEHPLGRAVACGLLREPAATAVDAARSRKHAQAAGRNIRAGQRSGELAAGEDPDLAGAAIMGAVRAALADALSRGTPPEPSAVVSAVLRIGTALLTPGSCAR